MMDFQIKKLEPFGLEVKAQLAGCRLHQLAKSQIEEWVREYQIIVFKGFSIMPKQEFALFGQQLGKPLQWPFGSINDLKVKDDAENYIFTDRKVPMHWDGAFAGSVPYMIVFQCIEAPSKNCKGGTTFANSEKMVNDLTEDKKEAWRKLVLQYKTEKIAHYGGTIRQKLIDNHPVKGTEIMRFAEPVKDINPVEVKVLNGSQDVIMHLQELIYREEYFYKHEWEDGDIVIADNYTLLHGREAFEGSKQRYIQRINILPRAKKSFSRWLNNSLTIRRKEFFVAELPIFLIPLFLSINSFGDLLNPSLILGLIAIFLLFNIGDMINCYADYKLDSIYKSHLSNAVFELGKKQVLIQIVLSGLLAVGLTIYVALVNDLTYLIPLTIVGLFIGLQYSIKPLKFKSRGIWQYFGLWGIIFFGPMLYTSIIAGGWPPLWHLLIFALYGFVQTGIILLNTAEDYFEDISYGLNTIVVKLGLHRALYLGYHIVLWAGFALQIILAYMLTQLDYLLATSFIALSILGWVLVVKEYKLIYDSIEHKVEKEAIKTVQKNGMKVPIWLKRIAYSVLAVVLVYFIGNQIIMLYGKIL